jgi:antitoxin VapB
MEYFHPRWYISTMALNIKDPTAERLAGEVAARTGETKTRAVRVALEERLARLDRSSAADRYARYVRFMEGEIWPQLPPDVRGVPLSKAEREEILGIGPDGA